jgi:hydrogenase maturation protein HypF
MKHHELHGKTLYAGREVLPVSGMRSQHLRPVSLSSIPTQQRRKITAQGSIKSVKFYAFVSALARRWDLFGFVLNTNSGVLIEVQGFPASIEGFLDALLTKAPPLAWIDAINTELLPVSSRENSFEMRQK